MSNEFIFLTGATGFVGRYVLRELLLGESRIVVLIRGDNTEESQLRLESVFDWLGLNRSQLAKVEVCCGDLSDPEFGKQDDTRRWLDQCTKVIHAAASVSFHEQESGEPQRTNFFGTQRLLEQVGPRVQHWVQVSTAYIAPIENEVCYEQTAAQEGRRNAYEVSKAMAEKIVVQAAKQRGFALTLARPGIVVGEHATGRASTFQGFYQPIRAIASLVSRADRDEENFAHLPLRLNILPEGSHNLVPVDWVAAVIRRLAESPKLAQGIFHLTPAVPTNNQDLLSAVKHRWRVHGIRFAPEVPKEERNAVEHQFYRQITRIAPYWNGEPGFDSRRLAQFMAEKKLELPCPVIDREAIDRLLAFAVESDWGRIEQQETPESTFSAADYLERFLPERAPLSTLPRLVNVTADVGFRITDKGEWTCRLEKGDVVSVVRTTSDRPVAVFITDGDTFGKIVSGGLSPQQAFFDRRIEIEGNIEMGLKLAMIFGQFVKEFPYESASAEPTGKEGTNCVTVA